MNFLQLIAALVIVTVLAPSADAGAAPPNTAATLGILLGVVASAGVVMHLLASTVTGAAQRLAVLEAGVTAARSSVASEFLHARADLEARTTERGALPAPTDPDIELLAEELDSAQRALAVRAKTTGRVNDLLVLGALAVATSYTGWPELVRGGLAVPQGLDLLLLLLPFFAAGALASWAQWRMRRATSTTELAGAASYVVTQLRLSLFLILPVATIHAVLWVFFEAWEPSALLFAAMPSLAVLAMTLGIVLMAWLTPMFARLVIPASPVPEGPLRDRLSAIATRCGVKLDRVLIWRTRRTGPPNAFAVGIGFPFRYVFISDGLLSSLTEDEVDAVFAHELGHMRHRHLLIFAGLLITTILVMLAARVVYDPGSSPFGPEGEGVAATVTLVVVLVGLVFFGFGYLSRRFERQADFFAATHTSPEAMASALNHLGHLLGGVHFRRGLRHFSIARRLREILVFSRAEPGSGAAEAVRRWDLERVRALLIVAILAITSAALVGPVVADDIRDGVTSHKLLRAEASRLRGDPSDVWQPLYAAAADELSAEWESVSDPEIRWMLDLDDAPIRYLATGDASVFDKLDERLRTMKLKDAARAAELARHLEAMRNGSAAMLAQRLPIGEVWPKPARMTAP